MALYPPEDPDIAYSRSQAAIRKPLRAYDELQAPDGLTVPLSVLLDRLPIHSSRAKIGLILAARPSVEELEMRCEAEGEILDGILTRQTRDENGRPQREEVERRNADLLAAAVNFASLKRASLTLKVLESRQHTSGHPIPFTGQHLEQALEETRGGNLWRLPSQWNAREDPWHWKLMRSGEADRQVATAGKRVARSVPAPKPQHRDDTTSSSKVPVRKSADWQVAHNTSVSEVSGSRRSSRQAAERNHKQASSGTSGAQTAGESRDLDSAAQMTESKMVQPLNHETAKTGAKRAADEMLKSAGAAKAQHALPTPTDSSGGASSQESDGRTAKKRRMAPRAARSSISGTTGQKAANSSVSGSKSRAKKTTSSKVNRDLLTSLIELHGTGSAKVLCNQFNTERDIAGLPHKTPNEIHAALKDLIAAGEVW